MGQQLSPQERDLLSDPRFGEAVALFNQGEWYACHDLFEALWHETAGPLRPLLQGILQIAVSQLHLERGNQRGATVLIGEGLGRLRGLDVHAAGLDIDALRQAASARLQLLQSGESIALAGQDLPTLQLQTVEAEQSLV